MEELANEDVLGKHSKDYSNFAFDEPDTREYVHSDFAHTRSERYISAVDEQHFDNFEDGNEEKETLEVHGTSSEKEMSQIPVNVLEQKKRNQGLVDIRGIIKKCFSKDDIDHMDLQTILNDKNFSLVFFNLFDAHGLGTLDQPTWFGQLRYWAKVRLEKTQQNFNKLYFRTILVES